MQEALQALDLANEGIGILDVDINVAVALVSLCHEDCQKA